MEGALVFLRRLGVNDAARPCILLSSELPPPISSNRGLGPPPPCIAGPRAAPDLASDLAASELAASDLASDLAASELAASELASEIGSRSSPSVRVPRLASPTGGLSTPNVDGESAGTPGGIVAGVLCAGVFSCASEREAIRGLAEEVPPVSRPSPSGLSSGLLAW